MAGKGQYPGSRRRSNAKAGSRGHDSDEILIWGVHPVRAVLEQDPGRVREVIVHRRRGGATLEQLLALAAERGVKVSFPFRSRGEEKGEPGRQGVAARILPFEAVELDRLLARILGTDEQPLLLALDNIQDPRNLGAVIRTALAAGVQGIIVPKDRSAPLSGGAIKASAGAVVGMDFCRVTNLAVTLRKLREAGIWICGTAGDADRTLYEVDFKRPLCLVVGGEEKGLRPLVRKQCDLLVAIPMQGGLESLNAATATAVVLYEIVRQKSS